MSVIQPLQLRLLNQISLALGIPWMHAAIDGPFLLIGPCFVPHRTSCYACFETRVTMNLRESASYQQYKSALAAGRVATRRYRSTTSSPGCLQPMWRSKR